MNEPGPLRLLLADDDDVIRDGYARLLSHAPGITLVAAVRDGREAMRVLEERLVDAALLDVEMPRMDGVQAAREIVRRHPHVAVVMFTAFEAPERVGQALCAGARGFLTKDMGVQQIVDALHQAVRGATVLGSRPTEAVVRRLAGADTESLKALAQAIDSLPPRLRPLLREVSQGKSNREIAEALSVSEGTVRTYITELLRHCGCASRTELAVKAIRAGRG